MKLKDGDYILDVRNNRVAYIQNIEDDSTYDIGYIEKNGRILYDSDTVGPKDIKRIRPYKLDVNTAIKFLELEITVDDFVPEDNVVNNFVLEKEIKDLSKHYLVALKKLKRGTTYDEFKPWIFTISNNTKALLGQDIENEEKTINTYSEKDVLEYMFNLLEEINFEYDGYDNKMKIPGSSLEEAYYLIKYYIEDKNKPLKDKRFIEGFMSEYIDNYDEDSINEASKAEQVLFKEFVNRLCKKNNVRALRKKGYCMYCNSVVFKENWKECRDIFEKIYKLTGDPWTANTLGYIYYYGRANKGKPEYEKAFRCFSIGAAGRLYESTYKLADCFKNGYGVVKNEKIAFEQYKSVYDDSIYAFRKRFYDSQFVDAALRMGGCYEKAIGVEEDIHAAFYYYLLAEYAIELRMKNHNHYGDSKVYKGIKESITSIRKDYKNYKNSIKGMWFVPLIDDMIYDRSIKLKVDVIKNKNDSYKLIVTAYKIPNMIQEDILLSIPEFDYCGFKKSVSYITSNNSKLKVKGNKSSFMFNNYGFSDESDVIEFFLDNEKVASLDANYVEIKKRSVV